MSTQQFCRGLKPIPLDYIKGLHVHFRLHTIDLLPDTVYLDAPEHRSKRMSVLHGRGSTVLADVSVALPGLFLSLENHNIVNVSCNGTWLQEKNKKDQFSVHFCFVPHEVIDFHRAVRHDSQRAHTSFCDLSKSRWNIMIHSNGSGNFDLTCFRPSNHQHGSSLVISDGYLGIV